MSLVCDDLAARWSADQRVPAEAYRALHPALQSDGEAAFELIYSEYLLRESPGESPTAEEFAWRFRGLADRLRRQLELHRALMQDEGPDFEGARDDNAPILGVPGVGPGLVVPGFLVLEELGRGGTGVVYRARQEGLNRLGALNVIRSGICDDPDAAARFRAEAEAAARFQHPNVIHDFEVGERSGLAYLALECAAGGSLRRKLALTPQEPGPSARLVEALAQAVHYAHGRGIVHRDLSRLTLPDCRCRVSEAHQ